MLKDYNKNIYWNLVWYFAEFNLPYDFIVPYEDLSIYEELLRTNKHCRVMKKLRLDQQVNKAGGVEQYIQMKE